ncbi:MAG: hypothetical protein QNJ81_14130 [Acidimicrobiia bacterium]|nr:hypothetical protein [Acidimicrobiia bacterium]
MKRVAILIAVSAVLLSSCRAEVRVRLDVAEDGSGTLAAEVAINEQLGDLIDQLAGDSETIIAGLDLGLEGERSTSTDGEMTVYTTEVQFSDENSIEEAAAGNFTFFDLELSDAGASLEATLDLAGEVDLSQFPVTPSTIDPETLEAQISVLLPGEVVDHNADEVTADGRLIWTIPLDDELYVFARTEYPTGGFPWWFVGLVALSAALALAVWIAAVRREKRGAAVRRPAPEPPPIDSPEPPSAEPKTPPRQHSPFFDFED